MDSRLSRELQDDVTTSIVLNLKTRIKLKAAKIINPATDEYETYDAALHRLIDFYAKFKYLNDHELTS